MDGAVPLLCVQAPPSPFVATKLSGLLVKCPNSRSASVDALGVSAAGGGSGKGGPEDVPLVCTKQVLFGKEGMRLAEHLAECLCAIIKCPDCGMVMQRAKLALHRPGTDPCPRIPMSCDICELKIDRPSWEAHQSEPAHVLKLNVRVSELAGRQAKLGADLRSQGKEAEDAKAEVAALKTQLQTITKECDEKITSAELRCEQKMHELRAHAVAEFVEFDVPKWSVPPRMTGCDSWTLVRFSGLKSRKSRSSAPQHGQRRGDILGERAAALLKLHMGMQVAQGRERYSGERRPRPHRPVSMLR
jgi:hypothetical protein